MAPAVVTLVLAPVVAVVALVVARRFGPARGAVLGCLLFSALGGWYFFGHTEQPPAQPQTPPVEDFPDEFVTSTTCAECHREQYDSWHRTYHRTMTRDATPENVKGNFANAAYDYQG